MPKSSLSNVNLMCMDTIDEYRMTIHKNYHYYSNARPEQQVDKVINCLGRHSHCNVLIKKPYLHRKVTIQMKCDCG